jgi:tRNA-modifying protein YgfZ
MTDSTSDSSGYLATLDRAIVCRVSDLGVISFEGDEAASFLHAQLSSDVDALGPGRAQWSTYNSPKGRVLATLRLWRDAPTRFGALVGADLAPSIAKRLAMFVLRAKVRLRHDPDVVVFGVGGPRAADAVASSLGVHPTADGTAAIDGGTVVGLGERFIIVTGSRNAGENRRRLDTHADNAGEDVWRSLRVRSGVPLVTPATSDKFVPQMLNFDAVGGVSFDKGCYPGQEVVARTRFLGQLKERLFALRADAPVPAAGTRLYSPAFGDQPCGTVVNAAAEPEGGCALLAVVQIAAMESDSVALGAVSGPRVDKLPLPYAVPAPETRARIRL